MMTALARGAAVPVTSAQAASADPAGGSHCLWVRVKVLTLD